MKPDTKHILPAIYPLFVRRFWRDEAIPPRIPVIGWIVITPASSNHTDADVFPLIANDLQLEDGHIWCLELPGDVYIFWDKEEIIGFDGALEHGRDLVRDQAEQLQKDRQAVAKHN